MKEGETSSSYITFGGVVHCGDCDQKIEDCFCKEALLAGVGEHSGLGEDAYSTGLTGASVEEVIV